MVNESLVLGTAAPGELLSASGLSPSQEERLRRYLQVGQVVRLGLLPSNLLTSSEELALRGACRACRAG